MTYDHADITHLSCSGAKTLLEPGGPAKYYARMTSPRIEKREFDLGHAVHKKVLGDGAELAVLDYPNYQTKAAQKAKQDAYDAGRIPVLTKEADRIDAAAEAVLRNAAACDILESGIAETVVRWESNQTPMRGMLDWYNPQLGIIADLKSSTDASPRGFARSAAAYHYELQAVAYPEALGVDYSFVWIVVELTPPYLVALYEPDDEMLSVGRANLTEAQRIWKECRASGEWPGLPEDVQPLGLPLWAIPEVEIEV